MPPSASNTAWVQPERRNADAWRLLGIFMRSVLVVGIHPQATACTSRVVLELFQCKQHCSTCARGHFRAAAICGELSTEREYANEGIRCAASLFFIASQAKTA